jgi:hypothetical protein
MHSHQHAIAGRDSPPGASAATARPGPRSPRPSTSSTPSGWRCPSEAPKADSQGSAAFIYPPHLSAENRSPYPWRGRIHRLGSESVRKAPQAGWTASRGIRPGEGVRTPWRPYFGVGKGMRAVSYYQITVARRGRSRRRDRESPARPSARHVLCQEPVFRSFTQSRCRRSSFAFVVSV